LFGAFSSNTSFGVQLVSNNTDGRNTQLIVPETQPILSSNAAAIKSVEILMSSLWRGHMI